MSLKTKDQKKYVFQGQISTNMEVKKIAIACLSVALLGSITWTSLQYAKTHKEDDNDSLLNKHDKAPNNSENGPDPLANCGYNACPKLDPSKMNVHIVAHTHDDAGWKRTVDRYYLDRVEQILNSVVYELYLHPERKFIYVEMAFFSRWWHQQTEEIKEMTKNLVNNGQLQFTLGHWTMPDEAITTFSDLISNAEAGLWFLKENFGACGRPLVGWHIDPFGHSVGVREVYKKLGLDALFFGRVSSDEYTLRGEHNQLELLWETSNPDSAKSESSIFTYFLSRNGSDSGYAPPQSFGWDAHYNWHRSPSPFIQDDKNLQNYNVDERIKFFRDFVFEESKDKYTTNNFLVPFGGDFWWRNANQNYEQIDKLIKYSNEIYGYELNLVYSTPSCYYKAVMDAHQKGENIASLTKKASTSDFFPYNQDYSRNKTSKGKNSFWSGYYSSNPNLKKLSREMSVKLNIAQQMEVAGFLSDQDKITHLRNTIGLMQHHDAITGTEKSFVVEDYMKRLKEAGDGLGKFSETGSGIFYNPLAIEREGIPALGWGRKDDTTKTAVTVEPSASILATIQNENFSLNLINLKDESNNIVLELLDHQQNLTTKFSYNFLYYNSHPGNGLPGPFSANDQASGAYVFRPLQQKAFDVDDLEDGLEREFKISEDKSTIQIMTSSYVNQNITLGLDNFLINYEIGPIPVRKRERIGKEVIFRVNFLNQNDESSESIWTTDSNDFKYITRDRNIYEPLQNISSRYYPATSETSLFFHNELAGQAPKPLNYRLFFDRAVGTTSLENNQLEIMLHRRTLKDDHMGVKEPLNDDSVTFGQLALRIENNQEKDIWASKFFMFPLEEVDVENDGISHGLIKPSCYSKDSCSLLTESLPKGIHLQTLSKYKNTENSIIFRFQNLLDSTISLENICTRYFNFTKPVRKVYKTWLDGAFEIEEITCEETVVIVGGDILTVRVELEI